MVRKFHASLRNAVKGMVFTWKQERNFRIESGIGLFVIVAALLLRFSYPELCVIIVAVAAVLAAELLNTIVEELLDVLEPRYSESIGHLKDVTAGLVLLLSLFSAAVGALTVLHHFFRIP
jgi:diacylglycerol kinase